ncbi:YtxH domain-containing protein [Paenibacillus motobuensis]|uniref:YtxH domain-containing protein n=1 Tax=Paenibacillus TaxID=44249 RepID=UPI00203BFFC7|nr:MULTISPECIES: YtxH domain-containing protein [Paenibacillus]MCM3041978.1 YtxH domain-containing protein [Paenibacillus lutimineralis]MCM3649082.1 YtxH domain-containing protein [Paenibacillus motobuensis]
MNTEETNAQIQGNSNLTKGIVIGALLGAAAALLFAPKSGRELRSDLSEKISATADKSKEIAYITKDKVTDLANSVGSGASQVMSSVKEAAADVSGTISEESTKVFDKTKQLSHEAANEVEKTAENATRDLKS